MSGTRIKGFVSVLGLVLVLLLVSCRSQTNKNIDLAVGQAAEYGGWRVTVVEVAQFGLVDDQTGIRVRYENNTDEAIRADQSDWELEDFDGERSQKTTVGLPEEALPGGDVAPGGMVEGRVYYDTPTKNLSRVVYRPPKPLRDAKEATWVAGYKSHQEQASRLWRGHKPLTR